MTDIRGVVGLPGGSYLQGAIILPAKTATTGAAQTLVFTSPYIKANGRQVYLPLLQNDPGIAATIVITAVTGGADQAPTKTPINGTVTIKIYGTTTVAPIIALAILDTINEAEAVFQDHIHQT